MRECWDFERDPLAALGRGEREPFEAFVRSETATFLAFFLRLGASRSEAEDLVQDLFVKLFRHASTYRQEERFAAFVFRIARNAWIDRARRKRRAWPGLDDEGIEPERLESEATWPGSEPAGDLSRREDAARLHAALGGLPEAQRLVFELGVVQELPYGEIAAILAIPVGTVKSRMFHAVRKLREALGADEGEDTRERA